MPQQNTMKKIFTVLIFSSLLWSYGQAQEVIKLSSIPTPESISWTHEEREYFSPIWNTQVITNVSEPTLTVYKPDPNLANGTSVVICPGGGFRALSINSEGIEVAKWLNERGVTAFLLKYRLVPTGEDGVKEMMSPGADREKSDQDNARLIPLAIADAKAALSNVRENAAAYGLATDRIGLMGFSAGGTVTAGVAFDYQAENKPNFVAPIYAFIPKEMDQDIPDDAPALFVACASNDQLMLAPHSLQLYQSWLKAGKPAELHMYSLGGHGFGMRKQNLPSDKWIERFGEWLEMQGLMGKHKTVSSQ